MSSRARMSSLPLRWRRIRSLPFNLDRPARGLDSTFLTGRLSDAVLNRDVIESAPPLELKLTLALVRRPTTLQYCNSEKSEIRTVIQHIEVSCSVLVSTPYAASAGAISVVLRFVPAMSLILDVPPRPCLRASTRLTYRETPMYVPASTLPCFSLIAPL